jgi:hypothetical protein
MHFGSFLAGAVFGVGLAASVWVSRARSARRDWDRER